MEENKKEEISIYGWHFHIYMFPNDRKAYKRLATYAEEAKKRWGQYHIPVHISPQPSK